MKNAVLRSRSRDMELYRVGLLGRSTTSDSVQRVDGLSQREQLHADCHMTTRAQKIQTNTPRFNLAFILSKLTGSVCTQNFPVT